MILKDHKDSQNEELKELLQSFAEETREAFENLEDNLLQIESDPENLDSVNEIFRVLHTIKGTAGFLNLDDISRLSHKLESVIDMIRQKVLPITSNLLDLILPAIDLLKLMVLEVPSKKKSVYNLDSLLETLESVSREKKNPSPPVSRESSTEISLSNIDSEVREAFVIEAEEHLQTIEEHLLELEKNSENRESFNEVFRAIHSIKGTSDYVNQAKISGLSHQLETIFSKIRQGVQVYDNNLADVVLKGVDILKSLVRRVKIGKSDQSIQIDGILQSLASFGDPDSLELDPHPSSKEEAVPESDMFEAFKNVSSQQISMLLQLGKSFTEGESGIDELSMLQRPLKTLSTSAKNIGAQRVIIASEKIVDLIQKLQSRKIAPEKSFSLLLSYIDRLSDSVKNVGPESVINGENNLDEEALFEQQVRTDSLNQIFQTKVADGLPGSGNKTMRIEAERLDAIMNLIGELIIARNSFTHVLGEMTGQIPLKFARRLATVEDSINRISDDLQTNLMDMRLISIKSVFQKIPRIVRDIARKTKRKIQLQMIGENTLLDKSILEMIGDPLVHIIRNCCDHGIESTEDRKAASKPETGTIILKASHLGNMVAIDIIDDGAGIDTEKVLKAAIDKGLVSPEKASTLDKKTITNFIFHPGFSTAARVSNISGRGVGMDVVISNIHKIHGTVDVESEKGQGTHIRIQLPLTLAVIEALLVVEQNQKYALPLDAVVETIELREKELRQLKRKEAIDIRGTVFGVARLSKLLDLPEVAPDPEKVVSLVILQIGTRQMGLVVDDLWNQQEVVVKPLQQYLTQIPGISGSTILGGGDIILILEPSELIDIASI